MDGAGCEPWSHVSSVRPVLWRVSRHLAGFWSPRPVLQDLDLLSTRCFLVRLTLESLLLLILIEEQLIY